MFFPEEYFGMRPSQTAEVGEYGYRFVIVNYDSGIR
jgi:hypothetical protein